jgi:hypothetical protein
MAPLPTRPLRPERAGNQTCRPDLDHGGARTKYNWETLDDRWVRPQRAAQARLSQRPDQW